MRGEKVKLLFRLAGSELFGSLLDVGGNLGIAGEFQPVYDAFDRITTVNLDFSGIHAARASRVLADGCILPFASRSFDWVFSNAVIEHVGHWERQKRFASEIRRVAARGYFVTTPNLYFPIEQHTFLPFYQFMPRAVQKKVARFSPGYVTKYDDIDLLSARELGHLFPEAKIVKAGFPILHNSLVAFYHGSGTSVIACRSVSGGGVENVAAGA